MVDLSREITFVKSNYVNRNEHEAMDEEVEALRATFLETLQKAAGMTDGSKMMNKAFMNIVQKKQKREPDGLSRTDKARFKQLLEKWEVMEESQKKTNE